MTDSTRPADRFAGEAASLDLDREAGDLLERAAGSEHGHAQRTLYRHGGLTVAMFAFRARAGLPAHAAGGVVSVQVLRGRITMHAGDERFDLPAGRMLRMTPGTTHDVTAEVPSVILLHVALSA